MVSHYFSGILVPLVTVGKHTMLSHNLLLCNAHLKQRLPLHTSFCNLPLTDRISWFLLQLGLCILHIHNNVFPTFRLILEYSYWSRLVFTFMNC